MVEIFAFHESLKDILRIKKFRNKILIFQKRQIQVLLEKAEMILEGQSDLVLYIYFFI